jgi:hypothetical protein
LGGGQTPPTTPYITCAHSEAKTYRRQAPQTYFNFYGNPAIAAWIKIMYATSTVGRKTSTVHLLTYSVRYLGSANHKTDPASAG